MASNLKKLSPVFITIIILAVAVFAVVAISNKSGSEGDSEKDKQEQQDDSGESERVITLDQKKLSSYSYAEVSADMLERVINGEDVSKHMELLKNCNAEELDQQLSTEELRLCFWINIYNAHAQYFLKQDATLYKEDRNEFFKKEQIEIAGFTVAMNDVEHGVLRRGATIWSKGHVRIPFRNEFVNTFKVDDVDYRIHFALNCGAKSCPPICIYLPDETNGQLTKATEYYLNKECEYDKENELVKLPALMTWFSNDFGSRDDKRDILRKCKVIPEDASPSIEYKDYDWTMKIKHYKQF